MNECIRPSTPAEGPLPRWEGYIFDLDGTLYLGEELIPGAKAALARLRERGAKVTFMTNKPLYSREEYLAKLHNLGLQATLEEVMTSLEALAVYVEEHDRGKHAYLVSEETARRRLVQAGIEPVEDPLAAELVIVSWDRTFTYEKLETAMTALLNGARFYATNPDVICPMGDGRYAPDCGAQIAALAACCGRQPDFIDGKPRPDIIHAAAKAMGLQAHQCAMVGDRTDTDIRCGRSAGAAAVLVLTGVSDQAAAMAAPPENRPDYILDSVAELV